jgi:hypothetical protein
MMVINVGFCGVRVSAWARVRVRVKAWARIRIRTKLYGKQFCKIYGKICINYLQFPKTFLEQ